MTIFKKIFITYLVIICCIYTPTAQAAGWSFGGFNFGNGSLNITKNGVKITTAAVDSAPITSNLGSKILSGALRGASFLSALSIIIGLGESAFDWLVDPANNAVKWKPKAGVQTGYYEVGDFRANTAQQACEKWLAADNTYGNPKPTVKAEGGFCKLYGGEYEYDGNVAETYQFVKDTNTNWRSIPIPTVAKKIYDIAKSGNTNAQADVTSAVTELVSAGTYDTPINQAIQQAIDNGTLPKDTTDTPTDPTTPTKPEIDTSSITAAIQSLASSFAKSLADNFNAITSVINTSIDKILNKQEQMQGELVNTGSKIDSVGGKVVGVGDKVDNVGGKVVGVGDAVKDVGGKVVGLNDSVDKVGDKVVGVGDKVDAAGDKVGTKVDAVGDKVTGVGADVRGVGDKVTATGDKVGTKVDAVGDKVTGVGADVRAVGDKVTATGDKVGTKVDAVGDKVADAVKESTKEITKKMDEAKPKDFELPAFCSWASTVCDFIDWYKKDPQEQSNDEINITEKPNPPFDIDTFALKPYISLPAQCPANPAWNFMGGQIVLPLNIVCDGFSMASWLVMAFAWLRGLVIVGSTFKG